MEMKWHLDAWDRDAGRAFVTNRPEGRDLNDREDTWGPTIYLAPPAFRPEPVANFALALLARRSGSYLPRVPMNEGLAELAFPTAEAVADFVRRGFISTGRGRDDGGAAPLVDGGPRTPPEDEGAPERIEIVETVAEPPPSNLLRFVNQYIAVKVRVDEEEEANPLRESLDRLGEPTTNQTFDCVESGAMQLAMHVLIGFPGVPTRTGHESWFTMATSLHRAFGELGLWSAWLRRGTRVPFAGAWSLDTLVRELFSRHKVDVAIDHVNTVVFLEHLFSTRPVGKTGESATDATKGYLAHVAYLAERPSVVAFPTDGLMTSERYDQLFLWSVPHYVSDRYRIRTVGQLMAAFTSSPAKFAGAPRSLLGLVAFAAALLGSRSNEQRTPGWRERAADRWLARSMPKWAFSSTTEAIIEMPEVAELVETAPGRGHSNSGFQESQA